MPRDLHWTDVEEIGAQLFEQDEERDPLKIRFTDLRDLVMALPGFADPREKCNEKILEAIQMAWLEEYREA